MKPNQDEIKAWLQKASSDLYSAEILLDHDPSVPETAAFHCQQAVEKILKALLVWSKVPFEKVHSLSYLSFQYLRSCPIKNHLYPTWLEMVIRYRNEKFT